MLLGDDDLALRGQLLVGLALVRAIARDGGIVEEDDPAGRCQSQIEIEVFERGERFVVAAELAQRGQSHRRGRRQAHALEAIALVRDRATVCAEGVGVVTLVGRGRRLAVGVDNPNVPVDEHDVRVGVEHRNFARELLGKPRIVRVEERDVLAARFADRSVPRAGAPAVVLVEVAQPVSVRGQSFLGVVGRAVVDDEQLDVRIRLREDALHRFADVGRAVVRRDRGRDARHRQRRVARAKRNQPQRRSSACLSASGTSGAT
jgi:hypothetical protein